MKQPAFRWIGALGALGLVWHIAPAFATRSPDLISGSVTSVQARTIVVNGVSYEVRIQGAALHQLAQVHVGDKVQLVLTGPKGAPLTQVSAIRVQNAR
jgi:hypothetical protein